MSKVTPPPPRLPDEPAEWYERFKAWLNLPRPRSVLEIANRERVAAGRKKQDSPPGSWDGKPALYEWEKRAAEWDDKEAKRRTEERAKEIDEWLAEEVAIARKMRDKGKAALDIPLVRGELVTKEPKIVDGREVIVEKITKLKGDPVAVKAAVYMIAEGLRIGRAALLIPAPPPPAPVNALQPILHLLPRKYLDMVTSGKPADEVFRDWALEQLQAKEVED